MDFWETVILCVAVLATVGVLRFVKRHGIVLRPDAGGLEAVPKEMHEAEKRREAERGR